MEEKTASVNLCTQTAFARKRLQYCTIFVRINQSVTVPMDWLQTDKKVNKPYVRLKTNNGSFIEEIWPWKCITLKLAFKVKCQWRMQPGRSLVMVSGCVPDRRGSRGRGGETIPHVWFISKGMIYPDLLPGVHYRPKQRIFYLLFSELTFLLWRTISFGQRQNNKLNK